MKLTFIGACHEVTGSCTLIEVAGKYSLVDFGMPQGVDVFENAPLPVHPAEIENLFLTHAHVDHSGYIPLLYKNGFRGTVFATAETCDLCEIMLRDCAHIQESEANYKSRKSRRAGKGAVEPLYSVEDAEAVLKQFRRCRYADRFQINENISLRFTDIGHLLGSACVELWLTEGETEKKVVFSGDVGNTNQPIINDPKAVEGCDYLVIESTYGNRIHERHREDTINTLAQYIQTTLDKGGSLIIPSFAVGRTQELLYFIREIKNEGLVKGHDGFPVYVDSPLANEATSIYMQCSTDCFDEGIKAVMQRGENPLVFDGLKTYVTIDESKKLNADDTPKVVISASGMCEAGRVCHHLKYNLWKKNCTVLFVGYQAQGTLGRKIQDGAESVRIFGDEIAVNARVCSLNGISGHADKEGLLNWIDSIKNKPCEVFVNHGEDTSCTEFAKTVKEAFGIKAEAPYSGTVYDLLRGEYEYKASPVYVKQKAKSAPPVTKSRIAFSKLSKAVDELVSVASTCDGIPNKELERFAREVQALADKYRI
ncbi:MAG: MBL fold metallo-hydrolase [Ruminococcus sp.]|nr:MBL fold metallo-hydrolase [Ruminococcus sp.]